MPPRHRGPAWAEEQVDDAMPYVANCPKPGCEQCVVYTDLAERSEKVNLIATECTLAEGGCLLARAEREGGLDDLQRSMDRPQV